MHKKTKFGVGAIINNQNHKKQQYCRGRTLGDPKGITLIALVITIVVLIILAGVAINMTLGENGIFNKAKYAKEEYKKAEVKEKIELAIIDVQTEKVSKGEQCTIDTLVAELPNKLDGMMIAKDGDEAKGVLDGYDFIIETNFNVIIGTRTTVKVLSITFSDPTWVSGTATIQITSNVTGTIEYKKNGTTDGNWTVGTTVSGLVHGDKVYAKVTDSEGDTSPVREIEIKDTVAPSQASISTSDVTYEKVTVTITTASTDNETGLKDYTYVAEKTDGTKVEIKNQTALTATITGLSEQTDYKIYVIAYDNVGNVRKSNEETIKTASMPVSRMFGQYVNYGIDLDSNGNTTDDWQIFYKEEDQSSPNYGATYIIADYYVPASKMTTSISSSKAGMTQYSGSTYSVYWASAPTYQTISDTVKQVFMYDYTGTSNNNVKCVSTLLNPDNWKDEFVTTQLQAKGGMAIGGPTINMWCASWNKAYPTEKVTPSIPDSGTGYQVNGSSSENLSSYTGYTSAPNVYFPTKSEDSDGTQDYWIASPSSYNTGRLMNVDYRGRVNSNSYINDGLGVRPLVYLPSSVTLEPSGTANVWNINYGTSNN